MALHQRATTQGEKNTKDNQQKGSKTKNTMNKIDLDNLATKLNLKETELKLISETKNLELKLTKEINNQKNEITREISQSSKNTTKWVIGLAIPTIIALISLIFKK